MDIRQGKINKLNKKIVAGMLTLSLVTVPFMGCTNLKLVDSVSIRAKQDSSKGVASFEKAKRSYFIVIEDYENSTLNFYIVNRINSYDNNTKELSGYIYLNIIDGKNVFARQKNSYYSDSDSFDIKPELILIDEINLENYLYDLKMIKSMYTERDINQILNQMKQNYLKENNVQK